MCNPAATEPHFASLTVGMASSICWVCPSAVHVRLPVMQPVPQTSCVARSCTAPTALALCSEIGQLAQQLAAVAQPMADALAAAATDADRQDECDLLIAYSHAASLAALGCAAAAWSGCWDEWPDTRNDLFRVVSAAKVVLVTGRLSLVVQLARAARQRQSGSGAADRWRPLLFETAVAQLAAMEKVAMKLACPHVNARLAATFAAAVAPPHLLLPWLAAVSQCLLEAWSCGMAGGLRAARNGLCVLQMAAGMRAAHAT